MTVIAPIGSDLTRAGGVYNAALYGEWTLTLLPGTFASGAATLPVSNGGIITLPDGRVMCPFANGAPVTIGLGSTQETDNLTAAPSNCYVGSTQASIQVTLGNTQYGSVSVTSGSGGLFEACLDAHNNGGGTVVLDSSFSGSAANITAAQALYPDVDILDYRSGSSTSAGILEKATLETAAQPSYRLIDSELSLGTTVTSITASGSVAAVRGNTTQLVGGTISAGFLFGTQGKLTIKGSLTSANFSCGLLGQLDLSAATAISTGRIAAIWGDCGATFSAGAISGEAIVDCLLLTNTAPGSAINSVIHAEANATYLIDASNASYSPFFNAHVPTTLADSFTVNTPAGVRYIALYSTL